MGHLAVHQPLGEKRLLSFKEQELLGTITSPNPGGELREVLVNLGHEGCSADCVEGIGRSSNTATLSGSSSNSCLMPCTIVFSSTRHPNITLEGTKERGVPGLDSDGQAN